jgi:hypothetical protein
MGSQLPPALAFIAASVMATVPAMAGNGPSLSGAWGNAAGCAVHAGGTRDDEGMALLTPEGFENYVTSCSFAQVLKAHGALIATALCGHEGEDLITAETLIIRPPSDGDGSMLMVTDANGNGWAEVRVCK